MVVVLGALKAFLYCSKYLPDGIVFTNRKVIRNLIPNDKSDCNHWEDHGTPIINSFSASEDNYF